MDAHHTVFYDGACGLCDRFTQVVLRADARDLFRFAPLQGRYAEEALRAHGVILPPGDGGQGLETVYVLTADGRLLQRADAVLFVLSALERYRMWGRVGRFVPRPLRELGYRAVARSRFALFGKAETCAVPTGDATEKFIRDSPP